MLLSISVSSQILSNGKPEDELPNEPIVDAVNPDLPNSPSDFTLPPPEKKPVPKWVYGLVITILTIGAIGTIGHISGYFDTLDENYELAKETIRSISQNADQPTREQVIDQIKACTILLVTIESLIDQMEPQDIGYKLDSLTKEKQKVYNDSYNEYFNLFCNKIRDDIQQTDSYQIFNKSRS